MRTPEEKLQHDRRIQQKENHIRRQMSIRKAYNFPNDEAHKYHKLSGTTCGDPNCFMCGNPRKFFGEETIQERKHKQSKFYQDDVNNKDDLN